MKMAKVVLRPTFYDSFNCIGENCEDTCCKGWRIPIDKETYRKYKKLKKTDIGQKIKTSIEELPSKSKYSYGQFKITNKGCPLLGEDGLCEIQKNLGESYLCRACKSYPRIATKVKDTVELSLDLSCPEVAKLSLLRPQGIDFELIEDLSVTIPIRLLDLTDEDDIFSLYAIQIRAFVISILQERYLSIEERMTVLGLFFEQLEDTDENEVNILINSFLEEVNKGEMKETLNVNPNSNKLAIVGAKLLSGMYEQGFSSSRFGTLSFEAVSGYTGGENKTISDIVERYEEGISNHYSKFVKRYEYMIENFLVMTAYTRVFPYGLETPLEAFRELVIRFVLLKLMINGIGLKEGKITPELMINYCQSFSKEMEHGERCASLIKSLFEELKLTDIKSLIALIKG